MKWLLFIMAWLCFVLGAIGAFLPVMPTTPFLILAAFLFSKSSPRFHKWLMNLPLAGDALRDWEANRVVRPRAKILCSLMLLFSLGLIWGHGQVPVFLKVLLTILLVWVGGFVVSRKSG